MEFRFLIGPEVVEAEQQLPAEQRVAWPFDSIVGYAYEGDRIIGRMGIMSVKLIEGSWVSPDAPPTIAYRMMKQVLVMLQSLGDTHSLALAYDGQPEVAGYLERVGFERFPVTMYNKVLVEKEKAA